MTKKELIEALMAVPDTDELFIHKNTLYDQNHLCFSIDLPECPDHIYLDYDKLPDDARAIIDNCNPMESAEGFELARQMLETAGYEVTTDYDLIVGIEKRRVA